MPITIDNCLQKFITRKRLAGLAEKSIHDYEMFINMFVKFIGEDTLVDTLTHDMIDAYLDYQVQRPLAMATLATYIRNAKIFLLWVEDTYNVSVNASEIVVPKTPKTTPRIYSADDIRLIFSTISCENEWLRLRNCAMVALMLDSGLRQSEVCRLKHCDVDFNSNILRVHGKGGKERLVPLGAFSKQFILDYLNICPYESDSLFVARNDGTVTNNSLKLTVSKIAKKLPFEFSCHKLRHNFATNYCIDQYEEFGRVDIYSLMAIMGHENIETTERYLHFAMQILASKQHVSHLDKIMQTG